MVKLRILRWEYYPGLSSGANVVTRLPIQRRQNVRDQERFEDAMLAGCRMEEGVISHGQQAVSGRDKEMDSPLEPPGA